MNILKWFKHEELFNGETEGDRRAREMFHKQVAHADKEMKKDFGIVDFQTPQTPWWLTASFQTYLPFRTGL